MTWYYVYTLCSDCLTSTCMQSMEGLMVFFDDVRSFDRLGKGHHFFKWLECITCIKCNVKTKDCLGKLRKVEDK